MSASSNRKDRREDIRREAGYRCGYCLSPKHLVYGTLQIDHLQPQIAGGSDEVKNLWLACELCNNAKRAQTESYDHKTDQVVRLFNPRRDKWSTHFFWSCNFTRILGRTPIGRATIEALKLNNPTALEVRQYWVKLGLRPPWVD